MRTHISKRGIEPRNEMSSRRAPGSRICALVRRERHHVDGGTQAHDRLDDPPLAQLLMRDLVDDLTAREHDHAIAETGELDRVARLYDHCRTFGGLRAQRFVDVEP